MKNPNMKSPPSPSAHQPSFPALLLMRLPSLLIKPRASCRSLTRFDKISTFVLDSCRHCRPTCDGNKFQVHPSCHPTARKMGIYEMTQHATAYQIMVLLKITTHWCVYIYIACYIYIYYLYIYIHITMRQLQINKISSVLSWWNAQNSNSPAGGAPAPSIARSWWPCLSVLDPDLSVSNTTRPATIRIRMAQNSPIQTSPYFSGEIDIFMLKLIVSQVYPIIPTFIKAHQSSSKLAPFGCLHQLHPKTTVKICFQHIPQTSKNWSTQPSTNAGKVFWGYPHCFQKSTTIFTNHSLTALQLPMAKKQF